MGSVNESALENYVIYRQNSQTDSKREGIKGGERKRRKIAHFMFPNSMSHNAREKRVPNSSRKL